ncbi:MAG: radical SAM protein [Candidatus Omnitrophota bacterium]
MNIFFIYPCQENAASFNYGLASVAAVLKQAGHLVRLAIVNNNTKADDITRKIADFNTDIIGFSCKSNYWQYVKEISGKIKSSPRLKNISIFVGGTHAIVCPLSIKESKDIDGFCIGEGEYDFLDVVNNISQGLDFKNTSNFYFNNNGNIIKNKVSMLIEDLDKLPFPDRGIFPDKVFIDYANFTFSRGCPYSCSYCCNSAFHNIFKDKGSKIRHRSVSKAIEEIQIFVERYKPNMLSFDDDCFNKNKSWFEEFCLEYKNKVHIPYVCNTRPELLDEKSAKLLKESGCRKINIGIESGDENLRRTVLGRNIKDEQILKAFDCAKREGIETMSFNMIGFPGEDKSSIRKTIDLNKKIKPTYVQVSIFYPYAGTPLGELCEEKGYVKDGRHLFSYIGDGDSILKLPNLSKKDIKDLFFRFDLEVYSKGNFTKAYIIKKIKHASVFIYGMLPSFIKNVFKSARGIVYKVIMGKTYKRSIV